MKDLWCGPCRWLIFLFALSTSQVFGQGEVIRYDSGYTWRGYTGTTPPVCSARLCHYYQFYTWETPYREFTAWKSLNGDANSARVFINFRVLFPPGYNINDQAKKYPIVIVMHGAGESGRVWTDHFSYQTSDPMYDNNSHHLRYGGNDHRAASLKPTTDPKSCQAIVVYPQASYSATWSDLSKPEISENEEILIAFIEQQIIARYHGDPNRVIMHGISNGAKEMWALAVKRPDLFAGLLPMSAVPGNAENASNVLLTTPIWHFQGELDTNPTKAASDQVAAAFASKGGAHKLTVYSSVDHDVWYNAYKEQEFFSWIMSRDKRNIHVVGGSTEICSTPVRLGISAGMKKYQWLRNGVEITGATERFFPASTGGSYTVRFERPNGQSEQSSPIQLISKPGCVITGIEEARGESSPYPNPTKGTVTVVLDYKVASTNIEVVSMTGQVVAVPVEVIGNETIVADLGSLPRGMYVIRLSDSRRSYRVVKD